MIPCSACSRFIRSEAHRCPFCNAAQRNACSPVRPAITSVLLGLALAACGGPSTGEEGGNASTNADGSATGATTMATMMSTLGMTSMPDTGTTETTVGPTDTDGEAEVTAYGGPSVDTTTPEEETAGSTATGDSLGATDTGTDTDTGTGTGTGTGTSSSSGP